MQSPSAPLRALAHLLAALVATACSSAATSTPAGAHAGGAAGAPVDDAGGSLIDSAPGDDAAAAGPPLVYAHTDTTLFQVDPAGATLTQLGVFDCIDATSNDPSMTDLAVDRTGALWGISALQVHPLTVQGGAVHCGTPVSLQTTASVRFYGLTFAPVGVLDATREVLVAGNTAGELWSIDGQGNLAQRGTLGTVPKTDGNGHSYPTKNVGKAWELSGDIVFLANGGQPVGFATVRDCPTPPDTANCNAVDTLLEIDVAKLATQTTGSVAKAVRGQLAHRASCNDGVTGDYGHLYGIGAWGTKLYGFSRTGNVVDVDLSDGSACLVKAYPTDKFAGAGVTTLAPVQPPPPK